MKKTIRLNETQLVELIRECVCSILNNNALNEMGTPKQNAFLRKLIGSRYKPEYDDYSVQDTSKMIDQELATPKPNSLMTDRQCDLIKNHKYYPIEWIEELKGKISSQEAGEIIDAINLFSDGMRNGRGYPVRLKMEYWKPRIFEKMIEVCEKYGLKDRADFYRNELSVFNKNLTDKRIKIEDKQKQEKMDNADIVVVVDNNYRNTDEYETVRMFEVYLHGDVETAMNFDLVSLVPSLSKYDWDNICNHVMSSLNYGEYSRYTCRVVDYPNPCVLYLWMSSFRGRLDVNGIICDENDTHTKELVMNAIKDHSPAGMIVG